MKMPSFYVIHLVNVALIVALAAFMGESRPEWLRDLSMVLLITTTGLAIHETWSAHRKRMKELDDMMKELFDKE